MFANFFAIGSRISVTDMPHISTVHLRQSARVARLVASLSAQMLSRKIAE
jgi:hypothetical protein